MTYRERVTREIVHVLCRIPIERAQRVMLKLAYERPTKGFNYKELGRLLDFHQGQVRSAMAALSRRINGSFPANHHRGLRFFFAVEAAADDIRYVPRPELIAAISSIDALAAALSSSMKHVLEAPRLRLTAPDDMRVQRAATRPVARDSQRSSLSSSRAIARDVKVALEELPDREQRQVRREITRVLRDARLRPLVIDLWGSKCAACGVQLEANPNDFECEVAHVHEVKHGGKDLIGNALPLCRTHHWAFDRNIWGIHPSTLRIEVAPRWRTHEALRRIHGKKLARPDAKGIHALNAKHLDTRWKNFKLAPW